MVRNILFIVAAFFLFRTAQAQTNKFYQVDIEQKVVGDNLLLDVFIVKTSGADFSLAASNFSIFLSPDGLDILNGSMDHSQDGPWDDGADAAHFYDMSTAFNYQHINLNLNSITAEQSQPVFLVNSTPTKIARLSIPITDHSKYTSTEWRLAPMQVHNWSQVKLLSYGQFNNPAPGFPLCAQPEKPLLSGGANGLNLCSGQSLQLSSSVSGVHQWYKDGVLINNANGASLTVNQPGQYAAQAMSFSCGSELTDALTVSLIDVTAPIIAASGALSICDGQSVTLTTPSTGTYEWFKNGQIISGFTGQTVTISEPGNYTAKAVASGCESAISNAIQVDNLVLTSPTVSSLAGTELCAGQSMLIQSDFNGANKWFINGVEIVGQTAQQITISQPGIYTAAAAQNGCFSTVSQELTITTKTIETPMVTSAQSTICVGQTVTLNSNLVGAHLWYKDGELLANQSGSAIAITESGSYQAKSISEGCESALSNALVISSIVLETPILSSLGETSICPNASVTLQSNFNGESRWFKDGVWLQTAQAASLLVSEAGVYSVSTFQNGCLSNPSNNIEVKSITSPIKPVISYNGQLLNANTTEQVQWFFNGAPLFNETNATLQPYAEGVYTVQAKNGCGATLSDGYDYRTTSVADLTVNNGFTVYPNPYIGSTNLKLSLKKASSVKIEVFDISGKKITTLVNKSLNQGDHNFTFGSKEYNVTAGVYNVEYTINGVENSLKLVEIK